MKWTIRDKESGEGNFGTYDNPNELITELTEMIAYDVKEEHITYEQAGNYYEVVRSDNVNFFVDASIKGLRFMNVDTRKYEEL